MSSCFGSRKSRTDERQPLLPQYRDDTVLQRELHQKLHSYQMLRALGKGFMPSNEQTIINLRTLLAADILNPTDAELSESGRLLVKRSKQLLGDFIELLQHKNSEDQIQDFIWYLTKSRITVDATDIVRQASKAKQKADTAAAYRSIQTVGSLLLTNSDFRLFLSDLNVVGREVFKDTAFALSEVAENAGKQIEPPKEKQQQLKKPGADKGPKPTKKELQDDVVEVSQVVAQGVGEVAVNAKDSIADKLQGEEKDTLIYRLKQTVVNLRQRRDYSESVSTLTMLIKRYAMIYSRAIEETVETIQDDIHENAETDRALKNFYLLLTSFGDHAEWEALEENFKQVMTHKDNDPQFEELMTEFGNSLQELLTDPSFFDRAEAKFQELKEKSKEIGTDSSLRQDVDKLLVQAQTTLGSVLNDKDVARMIRSTSQVASLLSPAGAYLNGDLVSDGINTFIPLLIQAIQYIPIPRIEVSTPDIDLLLENLIIEPGKTVNHTSFFPYRFRAETYNDLEIRKARFRTLASTKHLLTLKIDGMSVRAEEVGFWMRAHSGILRLADEGIASFELDERGIDVHIDVEIAKEKLENILTLKDVRVNVHKLNYTLRKSKFSFFGWILKPLLRPVIRKVMEKQLANALADFFHAANRELLFARERLRATRISDPDDLITFFRAVGARLKPEDDPDVYTRVGVKQPGKGVFKGVYAPGSVVKLWNEEAAQAEERIEQYERDGWRNDIFDTHTRYMS